MPEHIEGDSCQCWGCIEEVEVRNSALSSLKLLCEDRLRVDLAGYGEKPPVELPLLVQLKLATECKGSEGSASGVSRSGVPLDLTAMEMFSTVSAELHDDAVFSGAVSVYALVDPMVDARALVEKVRAADVEWLAGRAKRWEGWCYRIPEYLAPSRRTPIPGVCPEPLCRSEFWFTYDEEGARLTEHALRARWVGDEVDGVECACCFTFWGRRDLWKLGNALDPGLVLRLRGGSV